MCDIQDGFALRRHNSSVHISSSIDCLTFQLPDLSSHLCRVEKKCAGLWFSLCEFGYIIDLTFDIPFLEELMWQLYVHVNSFFAFILPNPENELHWYCKQGHCNVVWYLRLSWQWRLLVMVFWVMIQYMYNCSNILAGIMFLWNICNHTANCTLL